MDELVARGEGERTTAIHLSCLCECRLSCDVLWLTKIAKVFKYSTISGEWDHAFERSQNDVRDAAEHNNRTWRKEGSAKSAVHLAILATSYTFCGCATTGGAGHCGVLTTTSRPVESGYVSCRSRPMVWKVGSPIAPKRTSRPLPNESAQLRISLHVLCIGIG